MGFEGDGGFSVLSVFWEEWEIPRRVKERRRKRGGGLGDTRRERAWERDWSTMGDKGKCERVGVGEKGWSRFKLNHRVHC